jgi:hypothetical protein
MNREIAHAETCTCIPVYYNDGIPDEQGRTRTRFVEWKMVCDACGSLPENRHPQDHTINETSST